MNIFIKTELLFMEYVTNSVNLDAYIQTHSPFMCGICHAYCKLGEYIQKHSPFICGICHVYCKLGEYIITCNSIMFIISRLL